MNRQIFSIMGSVIAVGLVVLSASSALGEQKTAKACRDEWRANKTAMQASGKTEKAYVAECTAASAGTPAAGAAAPAKETKETAKEAKAKETKAAKEAKTATETPAAPPAAATPPAAAPPAAIPAAPAAKSAAAPPSRPLATGTGTSSQSGQFASEAAAKAHCPGDTVVWGNLESKIYHFVGTKDYGTTKSGAYLCEKETAGEGFRAAKNEKHP